jgi:hypothetical protein
MFTGSDHPADENEKLAGKFGESAGPVESGRQAMRNTSGSAAVTR